MTTLDHLMEGCQIIGFDWRYLYGNDTVARQARKIRDEVESNIDNITTVSDRLVVKLILEQFKLEISIMSGLLEK